MSNKIVIREAILEAVKDRMKSIPGIVTVKRETLSLQAMMTISAAQCPYISISANMPKPIPDRVYKQTGKVISSLHVDIFFLTRYAQGQCGDSLLSEWGDTLWATVHQNITWYDGCIETVAEFTDEGGVNFPYAAFTLHLEIKYVHDKGGI